MGDVIRIDSHRFNTAAPTPLPRRGVEPLWREVVGEHLRRHRQRSGDTLADTAAKAGISPQYLSELERGRKDPSSEILAAVAGALGSSIAEIAGLVHRDLTRGGATMMAA